MVESSKAVGPWRERIASELARLNLEPTRDPVYVSMFFIFARPKSHLKKNGDLTRSAPVWPATRPDLDKLARAALDAMTGLVFVDDSQVVYLNARKSYGTTQSGMELTWS